MGLQKTSDGWQSFFGKTPDEADTRVFMDCDKSPHQSRVEYLTRKATNFLKQKFPAANLFGKKAEGEITWDFVPFLHIEADTSSSVNLKWNLGSITAHGLDRASLDGEIKKLLAEASDDIERG